MNIPVRESGTRSWHMPMNIRAISSLSMNCMCGRTYRNQGVGTGFIHYIEITSSAAALQVEVIPSNYRAMGFYERMGFVPLIITRFLKRLG